MTTPIELLKEYAKGIEDVLYSDNVPKKEQFEIRKHLLRYRSAIRILEPYEKKSNL